ncbi:MULTISPECIES: AraC family transcriptional regulator [Actinosynnema]|uniref:cupin domain-containing protein n=1 Tax=Actinosynnema TaxID=40566 RepID=UPI0020A2B117|nr:AraC family transcriptional regulator [Actinosynnema pretiosum]MCP2095620.1 Cupin [Actinosynnema pretiosum]
MDVLTTLLDAPGAHRAFVVRSLLDPPWSVRVAARAPLTVLAVVRGEAWVRPDGAAPQRIAEGDVAVLRGPAPYTVADDPATPPSAVVLPGGRTTTPDGGELRWEWDGAPGQESDGSVVLLSGVYRFADGTGAPLTALPRLVVVPSARLAPPTGVIDGAAGPAERAPDRLVDLMLVSALRSWFDGGGRARADPEVALALRLLHADPAHPWTVAELAAGAGVSRAALAKRFTESVGEPPMAYLASLRDIGSAPTGWGAGRKKA